MTQDQAKDLYGNAKQIIEQQKQEAIGIEKAQCNLLQNRYRDELNSERNLNDQAVLGQKIRQAEFDALANVQAIEKDAADRLKGVEGRLNENVALAKQMESELMEKKAEQDIELRQKELDKDEQQKQRDELDRDQENAKQQMAQEQAKADTLCKENIQRDLEAKQQELEKQQKELERLKELERQRELDRQKDDDPDKTR